MDINTLYKESLSICQFFNGGIQFDKLINAPFREYEIIRNITIKAKEKNENTDGE